MKIAVFPGSFDPITLGHMDIIARATHLFDKIIVAIGQNYQKKYMFSLQQRMQFVQEACNSFSNVEIDFYQGLTVDYCKEKGAKYILRGLRNSADFEFEKSIAQANKKAADIETVFLLSSIETSFISSTIVRDFIINKGDFSSLVPPSVTLSK